ncbi:MAG: RluA family pseudouridine synthase [Ruminococcaceae bacterium]|nr:RluA family pseudouridine synthase [Oscillospiraceae bacterium]
MEKIITLEIEKNYDGLKIEHILKKHLGLSETLTGRLKRCDGSILLNGKTAKVIERVKEGDTLKITVSEKESKNIIPAEIPLDILYEDEDLLVINKPRSMPTHPVRNHREDTLANGVLYYLDAKEFHVITRLDKDTSGVVLIAKNSVAAAILTEEMKNKRIKKEYIAVVNGTPNPPVGKIAAPIKKKEEHGIMRCVSPDGKEAVTEYETLKTWDNISLVKLFPITGRTHQLRVHMSYIGNPIYGDSMYGATQTGEKTRLHCEKITFTHPMRKQEITVIAPIPDDIKRV